MEMEGILTRDDEAMRRSQIAIRCAKSAMLLLSLKSSDHHLRSETAADHEEVNEKQRMLRTINDLRMQLLRERMKARKSKLCSLMEFVLQIVLLLSLFTFSSMIVFQFL
ncbi:hypothetical protein Dimus_024904 [Dionaea muscipula]